MAQANAMGLSISRQTSPRFDRPAKTAQPASTPTEAPAGPDGQKEFGQAKFVGDAAAAANREREQAVARKIALRRFQRGEKVEPAARRTVQEALGITNDEAAQIGLSDYSTGPYVREQEGGLSAGIDAINAERQAKYQRDLAAYEAAKADVEASNAANKEQHDAALAAYEAEVESKYTADLTPAEREAQDLADREEDRFTKAKFKTDLAAYQKSKADYDANLADAVNAENLNLDLAAYETDDAKLAAINTERQTQYQQDLAAYRAEKAGIEASNAERQTQYSQDLAAYEAAKSRIETSNAANQDQYQQDLAAYETAKAKIEASNAANQEQYQGDLAAYQTTKAGVDASNAAQRSEYDRIRASYLAAKADPSLMAQYRRDLAAYQADRDDPGRAAQDLQDGDQLLYESDGVSGEAKGAPAQDSQETEYLTAEQVSDFGRTEGPPARWDREAGKSVVADEQDYLLEEGGDTAAQKLSQADLDQEVFEAGWTPRATQKKPVGSDLPSYGVQAEVQPAWSGRTWGQTKSGLSVPIDTSQETVQDMARQWEQGNVLARAEAEKQRLETAARVAQLKADYANPALQAEYETQLRGQSLEGLDPSTHAQIMGARQRTGEDFDPGARAAMLERARQDFITKELDAVRSGQGLTPDATKKTVDTLKEGLSFGGVDTRTYNPVAGLDAQESGQDAREVRYGPEDHLLTDSLSDAQVSPDNPLAADRAHFAAQPSLAKLGGGGGDGP